MALVVEVFPMALDRWVAVVEAPLGAFSTECDSPAAIAEEVAYSIAPVLGPGQTWHLVDDRGDPWDPDRAPEQLSRVIAPTDC